MLFLATQRFAILAPMHPRIRALLLVAVVIAAAVLYTTRLNRVPSYLSSDETAFALQAHAIATTAHDENGRLLPLYFQMMQNVWFHPALVYLMAPVLAVVRPMPWAVRLPIVIVALCNIAAGVCRGAPPRRVGRGGDRRVSNPGTDAGASPPRAACLRLSPSGAVRAGVAHPARGRQANPSRHGASLPPAACWAWGSTPTSRPS